MATQQELGLLAQLLSPAAAADIERRRREEQGLATSSARNPLLAEAARTAGMFSQAVGNIAGTDMRSAQERQSAQIQEIAQAAPGATIQEKWQNALPKIAELDPVLAMQIAPQIRAMGPQREYKDIRLGYRTVKSKNAFGQLEEKVVADTRTGVFENGQLVGYLGENNQIVPIGTNAPQAQQAIPGITDTPEGPANRALAQAGQGTTTADTTIKVGAGEFIPRGALSQAAQGQAQLTPEQAQALAARMQGAGRQPRGAESSPTMARPQVVEQRQPMTRTPVRGQPVTRFEGLPDSAIIGRWRALQNKPTLSAKEQEEVRQLAAQIGDRGLQDLLREKN